MVDYATVGKTKLEYSEGRHGMKLSGAKTNTRSREYRMEMVKTGRRGNVERERERKINR